MNTQPNGRRVVRLIDSVVNTAILSFFVILLALGCYAMWDSNQVYSKALEAYTQYKPTPKDTTSFGELTAMNPDVFGWLTVYGTHMDYPLVQGPNNSKYINTTAKGDFALSGAIFLDYRNSRDFSDFNSIIFGHHMDKNAMFGDLTNYNDATWFDTHQYGNLYYGGADHGLEVFAFLKADAYDSVLYNPKVELEYDRMQYLDHLKTLAVHWREIGLTTADHIVLLSTCTDATTNGRELIAARITDTVFDNPYAEDNTKDEFPMNLWEKLKKWLARFNGWWLVIPVALILPAAMLKGYRWRQRKRGKSK